MNVGSRVQTPAGPGTVHRIISEDHFTFGRGHTLMWIVVTLDTEPLRRRVFPPADIEELEPETEWPA